MKPENYLCPKCGSTFNESVNFCSKCGFAFVNIDRTVIPSFKQFVVIITISMALFLFGWNTQRALAGKKPSSQFAGGQISHQASLDDPEIRKLREAAEANPKDIEGWRVLVGALLDKVRLSKPPVEPNLVFETIDALRKILDLDPKDSLALIAMADLSFEQQAFQKAIQFYEQYLNLEAQDLNARARYASALTFIGRAEDALNELAKITKVDPKHFQATAYSAIALAQLGKFEEARKLGKDAIALAPSEEARARFSDFLVKIEQVENQKDVNSGSIANKNSSNLSSYPPDAAAIIESVKSNPIAGSKFAGAYMKGEDTLVLQFNNFPMDKMPQFAKDKFLAGIKKSAEAVTNRKVTIIRFEDAASKEELYTIKH